MKTDLQERIADSCNVMVRRITRDDQALHDLDQIWDRLENTKHACYITPFSKRVCECVFVHQSDLPEPLQSFWAPFAQLCDQHNSTMQHTCGQTNAKQQTLKYLEEHLRDVQLVLQIYKPWFFSERRERAEGAKSSPRSWTFLTM